MTVIIRRPCDKEISTLISGYRITITEQIVQLAIEENATVQTRMLPIYLPGVN